MIAGWINTSVRKVLPREDWRATASWIHALDLESHFRGKKIFWRDRKRDGPPAPSAGGKQKRFSTWLTRRHSKIWQRQADLRCGMELHDHRLLPPEQSKAADRRKRFRVRGAWRGRLSRKQLGDLTEKAKSLSAWRLFVKGLR